MFQSFLTVLPCLFNGLAFIFSRDFFLSVGPVYFEAPASNISVVGTTSSFCIAGSEDKGLVMSH